MNIIRTKAF